MRFQALPDYTSVLRRRLPLRILERGLTGIFVWSVLRQQRTVVDGGLPGYHKVG